MNRQEEINRLWSDGAFNYNSIIREELHSFRVPAWQDFIQHQIQNRQGLSVLDAGCGPAFFSLILSELGHRVTAIDASVEMLKYAKENRELYNRDFSVLQMDCHQLALEDQSFDLVISRNLTHTLLDQEVVYREWKRILKPNGTVLIFDANWHLADTDEEVYRESMRRHKEGIERFGSDFSGNTFFDEKQLDMEFKRERHLLGNVIRPAWDIPILQRAGFDKITIREDITGELWDEKEKLIYGNTPLFMIRCEIG